MAPQEPNDLCADRAWHTKLHRNDTATFIQRSMVLKVRLYSRDGPTSTANLLAQHLTDYLDDAVRV